MKEPGFQALTKGLYLAALLVCMAGSAVGQGSTQTKFLTAIAIPGNPIRSFDISWVNPQTGPRPDHRAT